MDIVGGRPLWGPNSWSRHPVWEAELARGDEDLDTPLSAAAAERLADWLPTVPREEFLAASTPAHLLARVALELTRLAGTVVSFHGVRPGTAPHRWRVGLEMEEPAAAQAALEAAGRAVRAARCGDPWHRGRELEAVREVTLDVSLGPSTRAIVRAARRRDIPVRRLNEGSLVQLGWAARQRRICTAETDRTSAIAEAVAQDKELTRNLLRAAGVAVPRGRPVTDAADAWRAALEIGLPVVVKPQFGNHGRGVTTNLSGQAEVHRAWEQARQEGSSVIVETFAPGQDHRLLVIGGRLEAAALREPAQVRGDGRSTVRQLVDAVNQDPRRSDGHGTVLSRIKLDPISLDVLGEQGLGPDDVPVAGRQVLLRRNGNLSTGGTATDVTDRVHPAVAEAAVRAARVVGLDIAGVDVVCEDIGRPLAEQRGAIVEVNASPGLRMHLEPSSGRSRPVGEPIVDSLFAAGDDGRIPLAAVAEMPAAGAIARLLAGLLARRLGTVGRAAADGHWVGGRKLRDEGAATAEAAAALLLNPAIQAAVVEVAADDFAAHGLGFDRCRVAVVGAEPGRPPGEGASPGGRSLREVLLESLEPGGSLVVPATASWLSGGRIPPRWLVLLASTAAEQHLARRHTAAGGRAVLERDGTYWALCDGREQRLGDLREVGAAAEMPPGDLRQAALPAVAAAWVLSAMGSMPPAEA